MKFAWRYLLVVAALMAGSLVLAACGGDEEEPATPTPSPMPSPTVTPSAIPTPTVTPASGAPPGREVPSPAVLRAGDALQTGALGSYCWAGFCADPFAVSVPGKPLAVPAGEPLIFELGFDPTRVHMTVWRPDQGEVLGEPSERGFAWRARYQSEEPVLEETPPVARTMEVRADLALGTYIVSLSARAAGGSASYGFHLEVVP